MTNKITIALDAMGGDHGVSVVVPAALAYLKSDPLNELILVGDETVLKRFIHDGENMAPVAFFHGIPLLSRSG